MADPQKTVPHIGRLLRHVRTSLGLTLRSAANVAHVNFTYLGQVERGEKRPTDQWVSSYVHAIGEELAARDMREAS